MKSVAAFVVANTLLVSGPVGSPDCGVQGLTLSKTVFRRLFGRSNNNISSDEYQSLLDNQDQNEDHEFYHGQENDQNNRNVDSPVADDTTSEQGAEKHQSAERQTAEQSAEKQKKIFNKIIFEMLTVRGIEVHKKSGSRKYPVIELELGSQSQHESKFVLFYPDGKELASMNVTDVKNVSYLGQVQNKDKRARIILYGENGQMDFVLPVSTEMAERVVTALKAIVHNIDDFIKTGSLDHKLRTEVFMSTNDK